MVSICINSCKCFYLLLVLKIVFASLHPNISFYWLDIECWFQYTGLSTIRFYKAALDVLIMWQTRNIRFKWFKVSYWPLMKASLFSFIYHFIWHLNIAFYSTAQRTLCRMLWEGSRITNHKEISKSDFGSVHLQIWGISSNSSLH